MDSLETKKINLLIVEDDDKLASLLQEYLQLHNFEVFRVASGSEAPAKIQDTEPEVVILDLMLPGIDGLDICRLVRPEFKGAIIMLTASQSEADHVAGLELGADDFVIKPVEPRILLARIRSQLRRIQGSRAGASSESIGRVDFGTLQVDLVSRTATVSDRLVPLTSMEFDVLALLARAAGSVVKREDFYTNVIGVSYDGIDRGLDIHISRIRRKLQSAGWDSSKLKSVRAIGYLLAAR